MPVHGAAPFLTAAIKSVYRSIGVSIEFLIVLDRCTNSDIWELIQFSPPNIEMKVIKSNRPGIVPALNLGIANSKNELIARLDSDDLVDPERFLKQVEFLERFEEVVCVGTQMIFIDEQETEFGYTNYPTQHIDILKRMRYQNCIGHPSAMFRKTPVLRVGGYREFLTGSEDYDLWLRLGEIGRISNLPFRLTKYRKSQFQFTNQIASSQPITESACRIFSAMRRLNIPENYPNSNGSLLDFNIRNTSAIQSISYQIANNLKAADCLNSAYREWSKANLISIRLTRVGRELILSACFSPRLFLSFIRGRIRFSSVRNQSSKGRQL